MQKNVWEDFFSQGISQGIIEHTGEKKGGKLVKGPIRCAFARGQSVSSITASV